MLYSITFWIWYFSVDVSNLFDAKNNIPIALKIMALIQLGDIFCLFYFSSKSSFWLKNQRLTKD